MSSDKEAQSRNYSLGYSNRAEAAEASDDIPSNEETGFYAARKCPGGCKFCRQCRAA